jgi:hypothetical protein
MKNLSLVLFIFVLLIPGCQKEKTPLLSDSEIPPDEQLIKISARNLAADYAHGKTRSSDNRADEKYLYKWLKVTGVVDSFYDKKARFGYVIKLETFAGDAAVECIGNYEGKGSEVNLKEKQEITVVGKLVGGGNARTLSLNPCKLIK